MESKIKTYSPICDRCLRLVYISFNFIKNYISTYCSYCKKISVYSYQNFYENYKDNKNPILENIKCKNCINLFSAFKDGNPLYLIEKKNDLFYIICKNCLENENEEIYIQKIIITELMNHPLDIYVKDTRYTKLKELDKQSQQTNNEIDYYLKLFQDLIDNIFIIELIIRDVPLSLRKKAEEKIKKIKLEIEIKKLIIDYNKQFSNFVTVNNKLSLIHNIYDFSDFKLKSKIKIQFNDLYKLIKKFLYEEKYYSVKILEKEKSFCDHSLLTKTYYNIEAFINDKNEPKELVLKKDYQNVLNINFQSGESIIYKIYADNCQAAKIAPICYNFIENPQKNNLQPIILYNYKNDLKLHYGIYNTSLVKLEKKSLFILINEPYKNILKIILINNGEDLFVMAKNIEDKEKTDIYFVEHFKKKENINLIKYDINNINNNFKLINNQTTVCIKTNKKLFLISKNNLKEFSLPQDQISYINFNKMENNVNNNMNNNGFTNNNFYNNQNYNNNYYNYNFYLNNNINYNNFNNINNNFNNNNNINNNFNNINNNFNNINNNFNNYNNLNNNFNYINNDINNNNMNNNNFNYNIFNNINNNNCNNFNFNMMNLNDCPIIELSIMPFYREIIHINNNYFVVFSTKHIKKMNHSEDINYLTLFNYNTMEEITKIEIETNNLGDSIVLHNFYYKKEDNSIILEMESIKYRFLFENDELRQIKKN